MSDTKLAITNSHGTFHWTLPWDGSAAELALACFKKAGVPYVWPASEQKPDPNPNCPKCGATSHCTWIPAGATRAGKPDLRGLGKPVGSRKERYTVESECLLRQCACGYEWLAPIVTGGSPK